MTLAFLLTLVGKREEGRDRAARRLVPSRALGHPLWLGALALLALNDHVFKGGDLLPGWATGKLSDLAGLVVAPIVLATVLRARSKPAVAASHLAVGMGFALINTVPLASTLFTSLLGSAGIPWVNWRDPTDLLALPALLLSYLVLVPAMQANHRKGTIFLAIQRMGLIAAVPVMLGSGNVGGANEGGHAPGSGDDGVDVGLGHIAVDPTGRYFLSRDGDFLAIGDMESRAIRVVESLPQPTKVAFWARIQGRGFFVLGEHLGRQRLMSYDFDTNSAKWAVDVPSTWGGMKVSESNGNVVVWSEDWLRVIAPAQGTTVGSLTPDTAIRDVDLRHDLGQLIVTLDTVWETIDGESLPRTKILVLHAENAETMCEMVAPNCADELVLTPNGARAFLAPTFCSRDPVSVLDLSSCTFEKNLPGFGPVALSQNAQTAVGFIDRDSNDPMAPALPDGVAESDSRYHLMFIDVDTLELGTLAVGDELPRYAVTPDGNMLLVDAFMSANNVRILDIATHDLRTVQGAYVLLDDYVLLPSSQYVYGVHAGLFEIDIAEARARTVGLSFSPVSINMVPNGEVLLLKDRDSKVHLFDVEAQSVLATLER